MDVAAAHVQGDVHAAAQVRFAEEGGDAVGDVVGVALVGEVEEGFVAEAHEGEDFVVLFIGGSVRVEVLELELGTEGVWKGGAGDD